jgi:hypothetical protein
VDLIRERFGTLAVRRGSALPDADAQESGEDASERAPSRARERSALRQQASGKAAGRPVPTPRRPGQ